MLDVFLATLSPMLVMFLCMLVGFVLNKTGLLPENAATTLSKLENYVFVPALVFSCFAEHCTVSSIQENYQVVLYSLLTLALALCMTIPLARIFVREGGYQRSIYQYALTFGNFGFMGNAIVPAILGGEEHLYKYLLFTLALNTAVYTWGIMILTPKEHRTGSVFKNLINPIFIALILGALVGISGVGNNMPSFVSTALRYFKECMGPLAMLLTGFVIGGYSFKSLLTDKKIYAVTALRLFVLPAIILIVAKLCGANDYILVLMLFAFATPLGMNTVVFPATFGGDTKTGASMAMISHTLCVVTIPIMYMILKAVLSIL